MSFDALLADMETLQKATAPAPEAPEEEKQKKRPEKPRSKSADARIQAAASGDADQDGTPDGKDLPELEDSSGSDGFDDEDEEGVLGKAIPLIAPDGAALQAYDATTLMKGFHQRLSSLESDLLKTVQAQTALIKSLHADVAALKDQGRGRKTVLNLHEKPGGYATTSSVEPRTVLAKALSAQKAGRLTSADVARIETYLGRGEGIPSELAPLLN